MSMDKIKTRLKKMVNNYGINKRLENGVKKLLKKTKLENMVKKL